MAFSQILERHIYIQTCFLSSLFACGRAELLEIHISDVVGFFICILEYFLIFFYFGYTFDYLTVASRYMKNIIIYLNDQSQVESLRDQKSNDQACFLFGLSRQIEYKNGQVENSYTRNNQVDNVEKRLSPDNHVEIDIGIRLRAARIVL